MYCHLIVVLTRIGEGQATLTEGAKKLKEFLDLVFIVKNKLLAKHLGNNVDEPSTKEESIEDKEEMSAHHQQ